MQGRWPELLPIRPSAHVRDPHGAGGSGPDARGDPAAFGDALRSPAADHMKAAMLRYDALRRPPKWKRNELSGTVDFVGFPFVSVEARSGFEPLNKGFADLCLTTWLPRLPGRSLLGTYRADPLKVNDSSRSSAWRQAWASRNPDSPRRSPAVDCSTPASSG
jgi:hypothetical protein